MVWCDLILIYYVLRFDKIVLHNMMMKSWARDNKHTVGYDTFFFV